MRSITIVGAGIAGTSLAYFLRETEYDVTVLEKRGLGAGTTGKSIACFSWYPHYQGRAFDLVNRSWGIYEPLVEDGTISFHENGLIEVAETDAALDELAESVDSLERKGVPAELLDPDDLREHNVNPAIAAAGAAFFPTAGRLDPAEIVAWFADEARAEGVDVETGVEVTDVSTADGRVSGLETTDGPVETDVVVNAAGPWAPQLNAMAGVSVPLKHSLAPISVLETAENFDLPTVILQNGLYATGELSSKVLVGFAPHESDDEDRWEAALELDRPESEEGLGTGSVDESYRQLVAEEAPRIVPKLAEATVSNEWQGIRCLSPDYRPMVGPTATDGFYLATGMSGWGITWGPACAQLLADYLVTDSAHPELESLFPDRFSNRDGLA